MSEKPEPVNHEWVLEHIESEASAARIASLERELAEAKAALSGRTVSCVCGGEAEVSRLRAALERFVKYAADIDGGGEFNEIYLAARAALSKEKA